jgi:hypothetical protein
MFKKKEEKTRKKKISDSFVGGNYFATLLWNSCHFKANESPENTMKKDGDVSGLSIVIFWCT